MEGGERALEGQAVVAVLAWLTSLAPRVRQGKHPALTGNKGGRATRVAASFGIVLAYVPTLVPTLVRARTRKPIFDWMQVF